MNMFHSSHTGHTWRLGRARILLAALVTIVLVCTSMARPAEAAGNRDWLRPGCSWDVHGHWIQKCWVYSPANHRKIPVLIQPAGRGGDGALYMLDGLEAPKNDNYWARTPAMDTFLGDNVTLVMPGGGGGQFYADWAMAGQPLSSGTSSDIGTIPPLQWSQWETFLTAELPVYLQKNFGVNPHRNSILGISMGALPAITIAARHRNQFVQATALSGFIDPAVFTHLVMILMVQLTASLFGGGQVWELYGSSGPTFSSNMDKMDPVHQINKLRGLDVMVYAGDGNKPPQDHFPPPTAIIQSIIGEKAIRFSTDNFVAKARAAGINIHYFPGSGLHTWEPWVRFVREHRQDILNKVG